MSMLDKLLLTIGLLLALGLAFTAGVVIGRVTKRPKAPDLNDPHVWLPIKVFHGELGRQTGNVDATVGAVYMLSDGPDTYTVMQNKIEVRTNGSSFRFLWPDDGTFVAGWCDILDVDGDGDKEFLLYAGSGSLRIVSFVQGQFQFRPHRDDLLSFDHGVGPLDIDGDGKPEFLEDEHFPANLENNAKWIWIPRVKRWSRADGFIDVSNDYPKYYREQLIPELERRQMKEQDPELRQLISHSIESLKAENR